MSKSTPLAKVVSACVLTIFVSSCATVANYRAMVNSWKGRSVESLIDRWGYPNRTMKAPNGDEVYVYSSSDRVHFPTYSTGGYTTVETEQSGKTVVRQTPTIYHGGGTYHYECTTWFEFNKNKIITRVLFRGNNCVATQR